MPPQDNNLPKKQSIAKDKKTWFKLSKPILFILLLVAVLIGVGAYLALRSKPDPGPLKDAAARAQEMDRVSTLVKQESADQKAQALSATVISTMSNQENGLTTYLKNNGFKVSDSELNSYYDKSTDAKLTAAAQNKQLEVTYYAYLRNKILAYITALKISTGEVNQQGRSLINSYLTTVNNLLNSPQLKTPSQ